MNSEKDISLKLNSGEYNVKLEETLSNIIKDLKMNRTPKVGQKKSNF